MADFGQGVIAKPSFKIVVKSIKMRCGHEETSEFRDYGYGVSAAITESASYTCAACGGKRPSPHQGRSLGDAGISTFEE